MFKGFQGKGCTWAPSMPSMCNYMTTHNYCRVLSRPHYDRMVPTCATGSCCNVCLSICNCHLLVCATLCFPLVATSNMASPSETLVVPAIVPRMGEG